MSSSQQKHIVELQSLRGIAALTVLFAHTLKYYETSPGFGFWATALLNAHAAVVFFYVLSGYVLVRSLDQQVLDRDKIAGFYLRRLFRIYPAVFVMSTLALGYVSWLHFQVSVPHSSVWFGQFFKREDFGAMHVIASYAAISPFLCPPVWSIFVELCGSLLIPAFAVSMRHTWAFGLLVGGLAIFSLTVGAHTHLHTGVYLVDFGLGASIALWSRNLKAIIGNKTLPLIALSGFSLLTLVGFRQLHDWPYEHAVPSLIEALAATLFVATVVTYPEKFAALRWRPARKLGDISYSLYLFHFPIMCVIAKIGGGLLDLEAFRADPLIATACLSASTAVITLVVASIMYKYVELPGIAWGRSAAQPLVGKPAAL